MGFIIGSIGSLSMNNDWLVVEPTPLKNMKISWDDYSQYMESHKIHFQTTNQIMYHSLVGGGF